MNVEIILNITSHLHISLLPCLLYMEKSVNYNMHILYYKQMSFYVDTDNDESNCQSS